MSSCTLSIFQASDSVTLTLIFPETIIHVCFPDLQCSLPGTTEFRVQLGLIGDVSKLAIGDNPSRKIYNVPVFEDSRSRQIASGMTEREVCGAHILYQGSF